jgi:hypothetical protein
MTGTEATSEQLAAIYEIRARFEQCTPAWWICCTWAQEVIERERAERR